MSIPLIYVFSRIQNRKKRFAFLGKYEMPVESRFPEESKIASIPIILNTKIIKILALICIIVWIVALLVTWNSPATKYESNIYSSTPQIFWFANILNFIFGIGIIIHQIIYKKNKHESGLWIIGFVLVFLAFTSIFSLWIIRGYVFLGQGDELTHLRFIKDIINTGHIKSSNYYPVTHIYIAQISEITNIPSNIFSNCATLIYVLLSIFFMYCLAKTSLPKKEQALLTIVIWMTYVISNWVQLTPNAFADFYFPVAIFVLMKCFFSKKIQWKVMFMILIIIFPLFHPLVGFVLALFIVFIWLFDRLVNAEHSPVTKNNSRFVFAAFVISLIWCVYWTSAFQIWKNLMIDVVANLTTGTARNLSSLIGEVSYAAQYYNVVPVFFKTYTGQIVIILLTVLSLITLWRTGIFKQKIRGLVLLFSPMPILVIAIVFLYFTSAGFGPTRLLIFVILLCALFVGYILYELVKTGKLYDNRYKKSGIKLSAFSVLGMSVLLSSLFVIGFIQLYPSRYTLQPNLQITRTEFTGMNWYIENKEINTEGTSFTVDAYRWASLFLTQEEYIYQGYRYYGAQLPINLRIPWHFGYDKKQNIGQFYNNDIYMILSSRDRLIYQDIWPEMAAIRLQNKDFSQVEEDPSVLRLYSNGGLDIYYVKSITAAFEKDPFYWAR